MMGDTILCLAIAISSVRVVSYVDFEGALQRSGIATAVSHHRRALEDSEITLEAINITPKTIGSLPDRVRAADLVHTHLFGPGSVTLAALAKRDGVPLICHAHVTAEDFRESFRGSNLLAAPLRRYLRWWYSQADLLVCPSAYTKRILEAYPVEVPLEVLSNGVDFEALEGREPLRDVYRKRFGLSGTVVATVGNVFERKGVSAFCTVARRLPTLDFVWFGPIDRWPRVSRTVRRWVTDPPENVTFTGWVPDKRGAFGAADIYFSPAKVENQGIAVLEAMACELPVVLSDIPAFRGFTTAHTDCLRADSIDGYVQSIARLDADDALRRRLGREAHETARNHRLSIVGDQLGELYRSVSTT